MTADPKRGNLSICPPRYGNICAKSKEPTPPGNATEHTCRPAFKALVESLGKNVCATNEPKRVACGAPDGSKDENVFDIMQGVAICIMVECLHLFPGPGR